MTEPTAPDASESAPSVERTSVLAPADLEAHDVRRALVQLAGVRGPTLAPLVRSAAVPGGVALTHRVPAGAVALASVRAVAPLRAGHVLAVGIAVLEALVALHAARLAHGGVDGESVLVAPDGGVVLAATGAAWSTAPGDVGGPDAAADVAAVGELLRDLLGPGSAPAPLVVAVVRAVDPDLALRPDAVELLEALRRCGRPDTLLDALWAAPRADGVRGAAASSTPELGVRQEQDEAAVADAAAPTTAVAAPRPATLRAPRDQARTQRRRGRTGGRPSASRPPVPTWRLFVVAVLAAGAVAGVLGATGRRAAVDPPTTAAAASQPAPRPTAPSPTAPSPTAPTPAAPGPTVASTSPAPVAGSPSRPDVAWDEVLAEVDRGRTAALAAGSVARLRAWVTGTAYVADLALARSVAQAGARIEGGGLVLEDVRPVSVDGSTAVLRVRDRRTAYAVVVGATRQEVPERASRTWTVTLVRGGTPARWRIAEVADA